MGPRAGDISMTVAWSFTDTEHDYTLVLANGVLRHRAGAPQGATDATVRISRTAFNRLIGGAAQPQDLIASGELAIDGNASSFGELMGLLDPPDPNFAIVTP